MSAVGGGSSSGGIGTRDVMSQRQQVVHFRAESSDGQRRRLQPAGQSAACKRGGNHGEQLGHRWWGWGAK